MNTCPECSEEFDTTGKTIDHGMEEHSLSIGELLKQKIQTDRTGLFRSEEELDPEDRAEIKPVGELVKLESIDTEDEYTILTTTPEETRGEKFTLAIEHEKVITINQAQNLLTEWLLRISELPVDTEISEEVAAIEVIHEIENDLKELKDVEIEDE